MSESNAKVMTKDGWAPVRDDFDFSRFGGPLEPPITETAVPERRIDRLMGSAIKSGLERNRQAVKIARDAGPQGDWKITRKILTELGYYFGIYIHNDPSSVSERPSIDRLTEKQSAFARAAYNLGIKSAPLVSGVQSGFRRVFKMDFF